MFQPEQNEQKITKPSVDEYEMEQINHVLVKSLNSEVELNANLITNFFS